MGDWFLPALPYYTICLEGKWADRALGYHLPKGQVASFSFVLATMKQPHSLQVFAFVKDGHLWQIESR